MILLDLYLDAIKALFTKFYWAYALNFFVLIAAIVLRQVLLTADYALTKKHPIDRRLSPSYEDAKTALDRMADWAKWLVGVQTGAMALVGFATKSDLDGFHRSLHLFFGILAILFLGASTYAFGWLLAAFPSVQQRLISTSTGQGDERNDIYAIPLFATHKYNVQAAAGCSHWLGIVGFGCLAFFFIIGLSAEEKPETQPTALVVSGLDKRVVIELIPPKRPPLNK